MKLPGGFDLQEMMKHGYIERVGNAYRMTDKVNIPDLQEKLQHRIDMILQTASELSKLRASGLAADTKRATEVESRLPSSSH